MRARRGGAQRHIVVSFGPPLGVGSADVPVIDSYRSPHLNPPAQRRVRPAASPGLAMKATGDKTSVLVCPRLRSLGHAILLRSMPSLQVRQARSDSAWWSLVSSSPPSQISLTTRPPPPLAYPPPPSRKLAASSASVAAPSSAVARPRPSVQPSVAPSRWAGGRWHGKLLREHQKRERERT